MNIDSPPLAIVTGASAGIGFAIPVDEVNRIVPRVIKDGKFVRPTLGIQAAPPQVLAALGPIKGVAVIGVAPGGAAQAAGIKPFQRGPAGEIVPGDVITGVDGKPVKDLDDLLEALEQHNPGDTAQLTLLREGKSTELPVKLGVSQSDYDATEVTASRFLPGLQVAAAGLFFAAAHRGSF